MGLIHALGINGRILLAQFFNFSLLVFVLWRFAYKPILNILEERRQKIYKGLDDAADAAEALKSAEREGKEIMVQARQEAVKVMEDAQVQAQKRQTDIVKKAEEDIGEMMNKEREKIVREKNTTLSQLKGEMSEMLTESLEKFFQENMDAQRDQALIDRIVKGLN